MHIETQADRLVKPYLARDMLLKVFHQKGAEPKPADQAEPWDFGTCYYESSPGIPKVPKKTTVNLLSISQDHSKGSTSTPNGATPMGQATFSTTMESFSKMRQVSPQRQAFNSSVLSKIKEKEVTKLKSSIQPFAANITKQKFSENHASELFLVKRRERLKQDTDADRYKQFSMFRSQMETAKLLQGKT